MAKNLKDETKRTVVEWNIIPGSLSKYLLSIKAMRMIVKFKNFTKDNNLAIYTGGEDCGPQLMQFITVCGGNPSYYGYIEKFSVKLPKNKVFPISVIAQEEDKNGDLIIHCREKNETKSGKKITIIIQRAMHRNLEVISTKYLKRTIKNAPFR
jgi:hypothetical protein